MYDFVKFVSFNYNKSNFICVYIDNKFILKTFLGKNWNNRAPVQNLIYWKMYTFSENLKTTAYGLGCYIHIYDTANFNAWIM